jgi:predicted RNA-binding Zn-ribbon protein involved in translation (DUF1610 family)
MTIRQVLIRRYWSFMLGLILGIAVGRAWHATPQTHNLRLGIGIAWGLSLFVFYYFGFRCPRCHTMLTIRSMSIMSGRPMGCPKCGVGMDEPMVVH